MDTDKTSKPAPASQPEGEAPEKQDRQIKARKSSLFESHEHDIGATRPFSEYLKSAPAAPLSPAVKAMLVAIAILCVVLLLAAIFGAGNRRSRHRAHTTDQRPTRIACLASDQAC
jgi:hypothetical protein